MTSEFETTISGKESLSPERRAEVLQTLASRELDPMGMLELARRTVEGMQLAQTGIYMDVKPKYQGNLGLFGFDVDVDPVSGKDVHEVVVPIEGAKTLLTPDGRGILANLTNIMLKSQRRGVEYIAAGKAESFSKKAAAGTATDDILSGARESVISTVVDRLGSEAESNAVVDPGVYVSVGEYLGSLSVTSGFAEHDPDSVRQIVDDIVSRLVSGLRPEMAG